MTARAALQAETQDPVTDTYGLPACDSHLIAKLRAMPEEQRKSILVPTTTTHIHLPKERP